MLVDRAAFELAEGVLVVTIPGLALVAVELTHARVAAQLGDARTARSSMFTAACIAIVLAGLMVGIVLANEEPTDPPSPPQQTVQVDGVLVQCIRDGGVQMAFLDGRWACIVPDQAG